MRKFLYVIAAVLAVSAGAYAQGYSVTYPMEYGKWQDALLAGNGTTGIMVFGDPQHETVVFTGRQFNFPGIKPREFADVPQDTIMLIKRYCAEGRFQEANDLAVRSAQWSDGGEGGRHPGFALEIDMPATGDITGYSRSTDYNTGEIKVQWTDAQGDWMRRAFVSHVDDVAVMEIVAPRHGVLDCSLDLALLEDMHFPAGMGVSHNTASGYTGIDINYPAPADNSGYCGGIKVYASDGMVDMRGDTIDVKGASSLLVVAMTEKYNDRPSYFSGSIKSRLESVAPDYCTLMSRHAPLHSDIMTRVTLDLGASPRERAMSNEELLGLQKRSATIVPALVERLFTAGRYHFLASGNGLTPPDLLGIWTGDCNVGWGGYYHLDANLNLQVSGGNVGAMPEVMEGYFNLNEAWYDDFRTNARKLLGCRGLLACGNTPGLSSGLMASINTFYPYHYATGEEAWLLYPFWEHYLVTRDKEFLRTRLYPVLKEMGDFYEDYLKYRDEEGYFVFAGSISPENQPSNLKVSLLNNSAFDVAGARFIMSSLIKASDILGEDASCREHWRDMLASLPPYRINGDGAIKEWGWPGLDDSYNHRHSSHLMMVWPYREVSEFTAPEYYEAARNALKMRDRHPYENAGHGLLHGALIAAGLHDAGSLGDKLVRLAGSDFYYTGLATSHYPDFGVFCTDVCHALPGIIIEMLVGSDEETIDLLPALAEGLDKGSISGVLTRCGVTVRKLSWNRAASHAEVTLNAVTDCNIKVRCGSDVREVKLNKNKEKKLVFTI